MSDRFSIPDRRVGEAIDRILATVAGSDVGALAAVSVDLSRRSWPENPVGLAINSSNYPEVLAR